MVIYCVTTHLGINTPLATFVVFGIRPTVGVGLEGVQGVVSGRIDELGAIFEAVSVDIIRSFATLVVTFVLVAVLVNALAGRLVTAEAFLDAKFKNDWADVAVLYTPPPRSYGFLVDSQIPSGILVLSTHSQVVPGILVKP